MKKTCILGDVLSETTQINLRIFFAGLSFYTCSHRSKVYSRAGLRKCAGRAESSLDVHASMFLSHVLLLDYVA